MKHIHKNTKLFIIILVILILFYFISKYVSSTTKSNIKPTEKAPFRYQHLSQPTITNPNPFINSYGPYGGESNYIQPYKQQRNTSETFRFQSQPNAANAANLQTGHYTISSKNNGTLLNSIAFTPVQCNNFLLNHKPSPSKEEGWNLQLVSKGIYILKKPDGKECLYASIGNTLKSYLLSDDCKNKSNVCGLEKLDSENKLDPQSTRTYFEIFEHPEGFSIRSVENKQFVCLNNNSVMFSSQLTPDCFFNIK